MVDYLCRSGVVVPTSPKHPKRGRRRQYSFGDVVVLRGVAKLLQHGVSVSRLKAALSGLRHRHAEFTPVSVPAALLVTDGESVYLRDSKKVIEDLNRGQLVFAFVLELDGIRKEIVRGLRNRDGAAATPRSAPSFQGRVSRLVKKAG